MTDILDDLADYEARRLRPQRRVVLIGKCIGTTPAGAAVSLVDRAEVLTTPERWRGVVKAR